MSSSTRRLQCIAKHCGSVDTITEKSFSKGSTCPPLKPGVLRLYSMRFCPFAQRTRLVLSNKNIPFETVNVDLKHKPGWLFEKNPGGLVPILEIDGKIIYEATATCEWLDDKFTNTRLQPTDPDRKAEDRMLLEYFGKLTGAFYSILRRPDQREKTITRLHKVYRYYENALAERGGPFFGGTSPAMIDFYLWPHLERIPPIATMDPHVAVDRNRYPKLAQWFDAMYARPEVKATMFDHASHLHWMATFKTGSPDYDYGL